MRRAQSGGQPRVGRQQQVGLFVRVKVAHPQQVARREAERRLQPRRLAGRGVGLELVVLQALVGNRQPVAAQPGESARICDAANCELVTIPAACASPAPHGQRAVDSPQPPDAVGAAEVLERENVHDDRQAMAQRQEAHRQQRVRPPRPRRRRDQEMVREQPARQFVVGRVAAHDLHARVIDRPRLARPGEDRPGKIGKQR